MDITGKLKAKFDEVQVSEKFRKRDFVLMDDSSQYTQYIQFQLTQDKCGLIDNCAIGSEIKVHFNINGKEWLNPKNETKYFNTLTAWRIEFLSNNNSNNNSQQSNNNSSTFTASTQEDDLPF